MAKLHKMVNGVKVDLTEEEEAATRAEWDKNRKEINEERLARKAEEEKKQELKASLAKKLDISLEELDLLMGKSNGLLGA